MSNREWRGTWWLPGQEEEAVAGVLIQRESDGELLLNLIGGFAIHRFIPIDENRSEVSYETEWPMILGRSGGDLFTLLDCNARHTTGAGFLASAVAEQDILAQRGLRGVHLTAPDEEIFTSAVLNVEYLLGWMRESTLQASIDFNEWRWTGRQTVTAEPVDPATASNGTYEFELRIAFNQFRIEDRPRANERSLANREWAELEIESARPTTFSGFDRTSKAIMDLMTLAAHAPAGIISETVRFPVSEQHPARGGRSTASVEVMGRRIHQPKPLPKEVKHVDYLFTLADISFSDLIPRWLDLHEKAWLACSILFGLSYIREGYASSRLLSAATAAESLHRSLRPNATRIDPERFQEIRSAVMDALKGKESEMVEARRFVHNSLYNEVTFKDRLLDLAMVPDSEAVGKLINSLPEWAKLLKEQRNGMAHGDLSGVGSKSDHMIYYALEITRAFLGLVLMSQLGLSADVQRSAVSLPYLEGIVSEFNGALPVP